MAGTKTIPSRSAETEALRRQAARDRAQLYLDVAGTMFVALDTGGRVTMINQKGCDILGYEEEEILGKDWFAHFLVEDQREQVRRVFDTLITGAPESVEYYENTVLTKAGERRLMLWHNAVIRAENGEVVATLGSGIDVTERRQAEDALRESEQRFRSLFEGAPDAIFVEDLEGNVLDVNPAACRLHHTARDTLIGTNVGDLVPPDQREAAMRDFRRLVQGDVSLLQTYRWAVDQHAIPVEIQASQILYAGQPALLLFVRDVSERVEVEEALKESRARAQAIMETTVDAVVTIDEQGVIESVNPATERIFGYTPEEMIGRNVELLMSLPYRKAHDRYLQRYLETGKKKVIGIGREVVARRKDGSTFPIDLAVSEVRLGRRRVFTGFIRDISERRRLEHEVIRISVEERQRIGRDLHDGLGSLLTGIAMGAQGLAQARKRGQPIQAEDLEHLAQMVEEGAAQAQALARGLNPVRLDREGLPAALQELVGTTRLLTKVACLFDAGEALPALNGLVATQLYWIAQEALHNAVKHARAKRIEVRLIVDKGDLVLTIRDDGTGLSNDPKTRDGTGLHIMPYRANLIGATFSIDAAPEGGTLVSCRLPLEEATRP